MTKAVTIAARAITLGAILLIANPRAGFNPDGSLYVSSCSAGAVATLGLGGPQGEVFGSSPLGKAVMTNFGCW